MPWATIEKHLADAPARPNLVDYPTARTDFSWTRHGAPSPACRAAA